MALFIKQQDVFLSKIERKKTKKGGWYVTAQASFMSSKRVEGKENEWENDAPFFVNAACFAIEANKIISRLPEKGGFVTISGKLSTNFYEKDGKQQSSNNFVIFSAIPVEKKQNKEETNNKTEQEENDECPF